MPAFEIKYFVCRSNNFLFKDPACHHHDEIKVNTIIFLPFSVNKIFNNLLGFICLHCRYVAEILLRYS